jgi:hypothetical protein
VGKTVKVDGKRPTTQSHDCHVTHRTGHLSRDLERRIDADLRGRQYAVPEPIDLRRARDARSILLGCSGMATKGHLLRDLSSILRGRDDGF